MRIHTIFADTQNQRTDFNQDSNIRAFNAVNKSNFLDNSGRFYILLMLSSLINLRGFSYFF
jgi:thiamine biosynthesis lipoprotein ApbE